MTTTLPLVPISTLVVCRGIGGAHWSDDTRSYSPQREVTSEYKLINSSASHTSVPVNTGVEDSLNGLLSVVVAK